MNYSKVTTSVETIAADKPNWKQPFNQAAFLNYDTNNPVTLNQDITIPPAQAITNGVIPGKFVVALNISEVNDTYWNIKFASGSTNNRLVIVHTEYVAYKP